MEPDKDLSALVEVKRIGRVCTKSVFVRGVVVETTDLYPVARTQFTSGLCREILKIQIKVASLWSPDDVTTVLVVVVVCRVPRRCHISNRSGENGVAAGCIIDVEIDAEV